MSQATQSLSAVRVLMIPLDELALILPNANVAEIVDYHQPEKAAIADKAPWLLGMESWRGQQVPVFAFEGLLGRVVKPIGPRARIVVCYNLDVNSPFRYFGLLSRAAPRLSRLDENNLEILEPEQGQTAWPVICRTQIASGEAWIPDLDRLAKLLANFA